MFPVIIGDVNVSPARLGTVSPNWKVVVPSVIVVAKLESNCERGTPPTLVAKVYGTVIA
jgi:hypothetical protein